MILFFREQDIQSFFDRNRFAMKIHLSKTILLVALLTLTSSSFLSAQNQPAQAVNQQDEVVNIQLSPEQGTDDVLQILRSGDKLETNSYVTKAFELKFVPAYEIRNVILRAVDKEKGEVQGARTKPADGSKSREFLVVTTTPEHMPTIEKAIEQLDVPGLVNNQGVARKAVRTKYRSASELANIIRATRATTQSKLFADDLTNTLYYDDSTYVVEEIGPYVEFYDVPVPQIEFDIQIIEVREDNASKVGLDWDAWKRSIGGQFGLTANTFEGGENFTRLDSLVTLDANVLANFLNYTVQSGNANLLQRSRLNASNLEPALISDVKRVGFYDYVRTERTAATILTEKNPQVDSFTEYDRDEPRATVDRVVTITPSVNNRLVDISSEEEGLLVNIQPIISTETVTARINIALNTVTGFDKIDRPIVTEQNLTNRFTLENNKQILLGTLERESVLEGRRGIPVLKDLPVLKYIFGVESSRSDRSRIFILATPTFSNVSFNAKSLEDFKNKVPALKVEERTIILEDGKAKAALERVE